MVRIINAGGSDQPYGSSLQTLLYRELRNFSEDTDPNSLWHDKERTGKSLENVRKYRGADKSLARLISRYILFDGENISFDVSLVIYIYMNSTNIPPIMIINRIYEHFYKKTEG